MLLYKNLAALREKAQPGGMLDLLTVSIPLILSLVTGAIMLIVDRLFLAHFSTEAMTGAVSANMPVWTVQMSGVTLVSIAQVFVGQFQGAKEYKRLSAPVWQMVWLSLGISFLCLLFGLFGEHFLFLKNPVREHALAYYRWLMCFSLFVFLNGCLSSFFVGRKKSQIVFTSSLVGNIVNVLLNGPLIFGWGDWIAPMGAAGAAIATVIGHGMQFAVLSVSFLSKKNREQFNTASPTWEPALLKKCLAVGYPTALDRMISVGGWAVFIELISGLGTASLAVITITQSMMLFFTFISQGVGRAVSSIAANAVGARDYLTVRRVALSAVTLNALFFIVNGLFFLAFPEKFAELFLPAKVATESRSLIISMVVQACLWLWIATFIDALRWIAMGMLTAVGDTLFMMWTGSTTVWILCILPTYYFVTHWGVPVTYSWVFSGGYYLFVTALYTWRYRQEKWKARLLIES